MYTRKYIKTLTFALVSIFLFSCSQENEEESESLTYAYETIERFHPNCKDQDKENGCMELTYTYPSFSDGNDIPVKDTVRKAIEEFIFDSTNVSLSQSAIDRAAGEWFAQYDSTLAALPDYDLPWEHRKRIRLIHQTSAYLSVEFTEYEFSGGTHGNEIHIYQMYRYPSGEQLSLSDLLIKDKSDQLATLSESAFREQKKFPDDVEYDERDYHFKDGIFSLNQNFALTEKGLLFHFNPYEIAPYSEGPTRLLLSYEQIDSLLADPYQPSSVVNNE